MQAFGGKDEEGEVQDAKERKENERQETQKRGTDLIWDGKRGISSPETREGHWKHPRTRRGRGVRKMQPKRKYGQSPRIPSMIILLAFVLTQDSKWVKRNNFQHGKLLVF